MLLPFLTVFIFGLQQIKTADIQERRCEIMLKTDLMHRYVYRTLPDWLSSSDCQKFFANNFKNCSHYIYSFSTYDDPIFKLYADLEIYCESQPSKTFIEYCDPGYEGLGEKATTLIKHGNLSMDQLEESMCELMTNWKDKEKCFQRSINDFSLLKYDINKMMDHCKSYPEQKCETKLKNKLLKRYVSGSFKDWFASSGCQEDMDDYQSCSHNTTGKPILQLYQFLTRMCQYDQVTIFEDCDPCHKGLGEGESTMIKRGALSMDQTNKFMCKLVKHWRAKDICFLTTSWPDNTAESYSSYMYSKFDSISQLASKNCNDFFGFLEYEDNVSDYDTGSSYELDSAESSRAGVTASPANHASICGASTTTTSTSSLATTKDTQTTEDGVTSFDINKKTQHMKETMFRNLNIPSSNNVGTDERVDVGQVMNPDPESGSSNYYLADGLYQRSFSDGTSSAAPKTGGFLVMMIMMVMALMAGT